ncbi:unnamed protein product [Phytophthora lilii]|uniref:Unnamed protein product n=1 Tax=Phytophthora lilii TaxID=2077276 RepID=A0A9W6YJG4_9STRA|nr:unnamed protein product [Phytophthora lilii]
MARSMAGSEIGDWPEHGKEAVELVDHRSEVDLLALSFLLQLPLASLNVIVRSALVQQRLLIHRGAAGEEHAPNSSEPIVVNFRQHLQPTCSRPQRRSGSARWPSFSCPTWHSPWTSKEDSAGRDVGILTRSRGPRVTSSGVTSCSSDSAGSAGSAVKHGAQEEGEEGQEGQERGGTSAGGALGYVVVMTERLESPSNKPIVARV